MRLKAEMIFLNIVKGTTDSLAKVTFLGHINFKISTEHQILMSTDCPDDMLSENITKDTMSSLQSRYQRNQTKLHSFPTVFQLFFPENEQEVCQ